MATPTPDHSHKRGGKPPAISEVTFVNGMRLSSRHWALVVVSVVLLFLAVPWIWTKVEKFETGPDYRIPYKLSKDYWLYQRRLAQVSSTNVFLVGDSVVWGEYVLRDGTLSHFLNQRSGQPDRFINAGVNGLFPLALEGLIRYYGAPLQRHKVILNCNLLWMSSPKADLQTEKEERFNHADLVPQFFPGIPCYKAKIDQRLSAIVQRHFTFLQWVAHLQATSFGQKNILAWTLEDNGDSPPKYVNSYKNPLAQITLTVPGEPAEDPERGPRSARHKPWSTTGQGSTRFEWVPLERSLQWAAFQRLVQYMRSHGMDVFVVVGPFNEHIMAPENRGMFRQSVATVQEWLAKNGVPFLVPGTLASELYADASHPLTEGYDRIAGELTSSPVFRSWLGDPQVSAR
jgi:hypothetical protein